MEVALAGETLALLPQCAAYWPRRRMLMVADVHFGKAASFRAAGVPVPHGTTAHNLGRLDALLAAHDVAHIVFLGDFLHARAAHADATLTALRHWRDQHPRLQLTLVRGNHDRHAGDPPPDLGLTLVDEPWIAAPFAFCHHPWRPAPRGSFDGSAWPVTGCHVIAGHLHPVHRLASRGEHLRLPCFVVGAMASVLPAFGSFTGGHAITPAPGERVFVTSGQQVFEVPGTALVRGL